MTGLYPRGPWYDPESCGVVDNHSMYTESVNYQMVSPLNNKEHMVLVGTFESFVIASDLS